LALNDGIMVVALAPTVGLLASRSPA